MAKGDGGPPVVEPKPETIIVTFSLDRENLHWLDGVAEQAGRNRSDTLREILRNVREQISR